MHSSDTWLTLSKAAARLNVHPSTLRRWADSGDVPVLLTPGGHRRFAVADLEVFADEHRVRNVEAIEELWAGEALTQARHELVVHRDEKWLAGYDEVARQRHRQLGQRLMGLTMHFLGEDADADPLLAEARQIGHEYGCIAQELDQPLIDALRAALFFRDTMVVTALHLPESAHVRPEASRQLLRRINMLLNTVQLAIAEVYDAGPSDRRSRDQP
jgi:excisionase family DNA binding protein